MDGVAMSQEKRAVSQAGAAHKRVIFRPEALQRYMQGREKTVLPRYVAPPVFALMWALLGLLLITGLIVGLAYAGMATAVVETGSERLASGLVDLGRLD
jgi:hypothetical protein